MCFMSMRVCRLAHSAMLRAFRVGITGGREVTRKEKEKITKMLEKSGVEVIEVRRNKALIRVTTMHNQPAEKWIDLKEVDETSTFIA